MTDHSETTHPTVSVVICTVGRMQCLPQTIESIRNQTYQPIELILVVGPSADGTSEYAARLHDVKVRHVDKLNLSHARNAGIRAAAGDLVTFIDDDCRPEPTWIEELVAVFETEGPGCGGAGGAVINMSAPGQPLQFRNGVVHELGRTRDVQLEPDRAHSPQGPWFNRATGGNMCFRAETLRGVGGFDETYEYIHEETDVCVSIVRSGQRIVHHPRAIVRHFPETSHNRRSAFDLNWRVLLKNNTYFALKHSRRAAAICVASVAWRHLGLLKTFAAWTVRRQVSARSGLAYAGRWLSGLAAGTSLGLARRRLATGLTPWTEPPDANFVRLTQTAPPAIVPMHESLRIALVCGEFGAETMGGIGVYTRNLAESLAARGHSVVVVRSGTDACRVAARGYEVAQAVASGSTAACHRMAVERTLHSLARRRPFDVVEAPLWGGEAAAVGIAARWPLVVRLETPFEYVRRISGLPLTAANAASIATERLELSYASGVIAISRAIWRTIEEVYDLRLETHARQATVVPLGLPPASDVEVSPIDAPHRGGPRFLYVGRLEARKGILELGAAFAQVSRRIPTATLWIVGADNSRHDGFAKRTGSDYVTALQAQWGPDVSSRVTFLGQVSEAAKNFLYSECDVFVAPSRYESFGIVLLEAMRFNKPVVATHAGGIPEIVDHGRTGLLVSPEAPDRLTEAMLTLSGDENLRRQMGAAGLERFLDQFSVQEFTLRTERFYRDVIRRWQRVPAHGDNPASVRPADGGRWRPARLDPPDSSQPSQPHIAGSGYESTSHEHSWPASGSHSQR